MAVPADRPVIHDVFLNELAQSCSTIFEEDGADPGRRGRLLLSLVRLTTASIFLTGAAALACFSRRAQATSSDSLGNPAKGGINGHAD
jgi:hypothetical protein